MIYSAAVFEDAGIAAVATWEPMMSSIVKGTSRTGAHILISSADYEGLITESADGRLLPGVAESWSVSDDGLTYTFLLNPSARWSDGNPVTAQDFVRGFRRVATDELVVGSEVLQLVGDDLRCRT